MVAASFFARQQFGDFPTDGDFRLARQRPPVNQNFAAVRHDVRLRAAGNFPDVHRARSKQLVFPPFQLCRVICFQRVHDARHFMHGIFAKVRSRAMRRAAMRGEFQPQAALVRRYDLKFCRLAHDGQIRLELIFDESAGAGLRVFFVNQTGKDNFRFPADAIWNWQVHTTRRASRRRNLWCRTRRARAGGSFCAVE